MKKTDLSREDKAIIENGVTPGGIRLFRKTIYRYYRNDGRDLPWRNTGNPYRILVSEIMLQQTQVDRVVAKYGQFIEEFPCYFSLAEAPLKDILGVWQGLGYNRRALSLKNIGEMVVEKFSGKTPARLEDLVSLPGIGHATASAILAFAFNRPVIFIETNIRRVFIHFFFQEKDRVRDGEILPLVEKTLDGKNPRKWYYALMDYGAMLKKKVPNPNVKSAHYLKQPPFAGSSRQLRGKILKFLLDNPGGTGKKMEGVLNADLGIIKDCLQQLEKEGFIKREGKRYSIA
jgi:A/G-specific adenine glycosylase